MNWQEFAAQWCADWNSHDLDRILAHFAEDAEFVSPLAARRIPGSGGRVIGKQALRAYWAEGLRSGELHFSVEQVFGGIDMVVIQYTNHRDERVCEVLRFSSGKVVSGSAAYAGNAGDTAPLHG